MHTKVIWLSQTCVHVNVNGDPGVPAVKERKQEDVTTHHLVLVKKTVVGSQLRQFHVIQVSARLIM